ncbi:MAG TPA: ABC transporter ATP-binding protein [Erysipelothrix sp.]|nr:ABC transporter ATP-binding protein [Erysipelothrix sp.]
MSRRRIGTAKPKDQKASLKRLLAYLGQNKMMLLVVVILSTLATLGGLYGAYAISPIITIIEQGLKGTMPRAAVTSALIKQLSLLFVIFLSEVLMSYFAARLMLIISQRTVYRIREEMFARMVKLDVRYHDQNSHGDLMSRFTNDVDLIQEGLNTAAAKLVVEAMSLVGTIAYMIYLSPVLSLVTLAIIPLLMLLSRTIISYSRRYARQQQKSLGNLNGYIEESVEGQIVMQLFNHEEKAHETLSEHSNHFRSRTRLAQMSSAMMFPLMQNVNTINYALIGIVGGYLSINHGLSIGNLGAYVNMTRTLGRPINHLANHYTILQQSLAAAERVFELLDWEEEPFSEDEIVLNDNVKGDIVFKDVHFGYTQGQEVLKGISFWAKSGQKIAFVGSTGAGKTTIINLISRFYDINSGEITLDDMSLYDINRYSLRKNIAMVLQDTNLFTGTIMDNIRYGNLKATDEECIAAAKLANAHHFIERLEFGYDTVISGSGDELSEGQKQLLNIARAAVANPKILILDEATSSIDTRTERLIEVGMDRLMEGRTTFVIAHRLSTVRNSNAILVLENGEIIERGGHDELLELDGRYASLYTGQSELT